MEARGGGQKEEMPCFLQRLGVHWMLWVDVKGIFTFTKSPCTNAFLTSSKSLTLKKEKKNVVDTV